MDSKRHRRIKDLFSKALELDGAQREEFLAEHCGDDSALRAEVEDLLASDREAATGPLARALNEDRPLQASPTPGAMIAGRYRIITLLGRGGMGEVFLAEDITLGQQVALKFLPGHIEARAGGLERFLEEVRVARRVGHPNVARVHDVGESDGRRFLSMEYVDGEDLAHLLKRIGRLPSEKAEEIARQLCAGLDAIHSAGILHRDLKPANVMLDGDGNVRITDFGLAASTAASTESKSVAGTPGYMAPEQLDGRPAGERSEIFSLGLLLYELFTGKRAFHGRTFNELRAEYADKTPSSPSSVIADLDPTVEAAILACLQKDPASRPPSVRAVALSLPGGDPIAAALAAGKTPAPQVVADASDTSGMSPRLALACLAGFLLCVALAVTIFQRARTAMPPYPAEVLVKEARDFLESIGHDVPRRDSIYDFDSRFDVIARRERTGGESGSDAVDDGGMRRERSFWYRESPRELVQQAQFLVGPRWDDPPQAIAGMVRLRTTTRGVLRSFSRVPPAYLDGAADEEPDWSPFLEAAGFGGDVLQSVEPRWAHDVHSDSIQAWEIAGNETRHGVRIEVASAAGIPTSFQVMRADRPPPAAPTPERNGIRSLTGLIQYLFLLGTVILAAHNIKHSRCDRRGAARVALFILVMLFISWLGSANHSTNIYQELTALQVRLATGLFFAAVAGIGYLAIEPYFRRLWPRLLVSWLRVLDGRWRDRLVGRDVLLGALAGAVFSLLVAGSVVARMKLETADFTSSLTAITAPSYRVSGIAAILRRSVEAGFETTTGLVVLRLVLRKQGFAVVALWGLFLLLSVQNFGLDWMGLTFSLLGGVIFFGLFLRVGMLGVVTFNFVLYLLYEGIYTTDIDSWYFTSSSLELLLIVSIGVGAYRVTTAGRPMFRDVLEGGEGVRRS